jgi:hypothetical protein
MNEPRNRDEKLLAETFHGDWNDGAAAQFARAAAASARRRRQMQKMLVGAGAAVVVAGTAFVALPSRHPAHRPLETAAAAPRGYEIISDAELLSELRDRSVVMIKKENGVRDFVVAGR